MNKIIVFIFFIFKAFPVFAHEVLDLAKEGDLKRYQEISSNIIPIEKKEKVYLDEEKDVAETSVFVFESRHSDAKEEAMNYIQKELRVESAHDVLEEEYLRGSYREKSRRRNLSQLGVNVDKFDKRTIKTKKYNFIAKVKGYTQLEFEIIDGKDIFGKDCTLVVLTRYDSYKDYIREVHTGIELPFRKRRTTRILTDSEVKLMEDLKTQIGAKHMAWFIPKFPYYPLLNVKLMKQIKKEVDEF